MPDHETDQDDAAAERSASIVRETDPPAPPQPEPVRFLYHAEILDDQGRLLRTWQTYFDGPIDLAGLTIRLRPDKPPQPLRVARFVALHREDGIELTEADAPGYRRAPILRDAAVTFAKSMGDWGPVRFVSGWDSQVGGTCVSPMTPVDRCSMEQPQAAPPSPSKPPEDPIDADAL